MADSVETSDDRSLRKRVRKPAAPKPSQSGGLPGLQSAVNDTSSRAAALWLSFLTFMAYLTMTVGAVTHEALLRQTPIKLPVLNVELPLVGFFWIAPLFFLLFHFYLFLQLIILVRKVASFDAALRTIVETDQEREEYRRRLDTFLIVQFLIGAEEERKGLTAKMLRSVALITLVILPILLLLQFQLTFVPYHDAWVTWVHRIAVVIDIRLAWVFWSAIGRGDGKIYFPEIQFAWQGFFKREAFVSNVKAMLAEIGLAIRSGFRSNRAGFIGSLGTIFASFFVFAFADEPIANIVRVPVPRIDNNEIIWERKSLADLVLHGRINMVEGRPGTWFSNVLVVPDKKLVSDSAVDKDFPSLSLRGRNLSGAILIGSDLRSVDFTGANLNGAVLNRAQLAYARFGCAAPYDGRKKLRWPDDECTWLERASFAQAQLQGAQLLRARMRNAILIAAKLDGADMTAAQLQGAMLSNASLVGVSLSGAKLNDAYLDGTVFIGVNFSDAQLQGVLLGRTIFHLASIQYVSHPSIDKVPVRVAKPFGDENTENVDDRISGYFALASVAPVFPELNSENVAATFDPGSLAKFRRSAIDSLTPYGIIERDFEVTYDHAVERKWNEIAQLTKSGPYDLEKIRDYLLQLACNVGSASFITPALIRSERIMIAGDRAIDVINTLKNPDQCPGAQSLKPSQKVHLEYLEQKMKKGPRTVDGAGGSNMGGGSVAADLSQQPSAAQAAVAR
jgi:uncharacterized protein YjbI with pentapeptide repeats